MTKSSGMMSRANEFLWHHLPWRIYRRLHTWRAIRVGDRDFKLPVLGGRHLPFELLTDAWRREVILRLMPKDGSCFIDVGANLGHTLIDVQCSAPGSRYVGFEPNVACVDYVHQLMRLNGIVDWQVVPAALSDRNTVLNLWLRPGAQTDEMATTISGLRPEDELTAQLVPSLVFDDIRGGITPESIRLVKIDVEGAELEVIRGMARLLDEERPPILCEVLYPFPSADTNVTRARNDSLAELLRSHKYGLLHIHKTASGALSGTTRIASFPQKVWSPENKHECDYLFVPDEDLDRVEFLFG